MTLNFAPWAISGAEAKASDARTAAFAASGGQSGVVTPTDMRVTALAVPGNGLRVSSGSSVVLNHYQGDPNEAYVVSNPGTHTVLSADMPPAVGAITHYLVCVVVGDPEFDQAGHPYMPSTPLSPEDAIDFEYTRIVVVPCSAGTKRFEELGLDYPAYALARIERPASTTTITNAMITDLRTLTKPRSMPEVLAGRPSSTRSSLNSTTSPGGAWYEWVDFRPYIEVPRWATRMQIITTLISVGNTDGPAVAEVRTVAHDVSGPFTDFNTSDNQGRHTIITTHDLNVSAVAGSSIQLRVQGRENFDLGPGYAFVDERTQVVFDVRFSENVI